MEWEFDLFQSRNEYEKISVSKEPPFGKGGGEQCELKGLNPPVATLLPPCQRGHFLCLSKIFLIFVL